MVEMVMRACSSGTESGSPTGQVWGGRAKSSMEMVKHKKPLTFLGAWVEPGT